MNKQRWRILKFGIEIQDFEEIDKLVHTCFALHNLILLYSRRVDRANPVRSANEEADPLDIEEEGRIPSVIFSRSIQNLPLNVTLPPRRPIDAFEVRQFKVIENSIYHVMHGEVVWPSRYCDTVLGMDEFDLQIDPVQEDMS
jgi:hypothetical protein